MINQKIQVKIDEVKKQLAEIKKAPNDPQERREIIKSVVGDAEIYLENLLVWLRNL